MEKVIARFVMIVQIEQTETVTNAASEENKIL
jgi:hypothetical protein